MTHSPNIPDISSRDMPAHKVLADDPKNPCWAKKIHPDEDSARQNISAKFVRSPRTVMTKKSNRHCFQPEVNEWNEVCFLLEAVRLPLSSKGEILCTLGRPWIETGRCRPSQMAPAGLICDDNRLPFCSGSSRREQRSSCRARMRASEILPFSVRHLSVTWKCKVSFVLDVSTATGNPP